MADYETFGRCLQRILAEHQLSASEVARMVGFRSRNSIFRILNDETSCDVDARFLATLQDKVKADWPQAHWQQLENALHIKRVGVERHLSDKAFCNGMGGHSEKKEYLVESDGKVRPLDAMLRELCAQGEISVVICGCCERNLMSMLSSCFYEAGSDGRLTVRHYFDIGRSVMVHNILAALPMMSKVWYNARLVDDKHCPAEMRAVYRLNVICLMEMAADGQQTAHQFLQVDGDRFVHQQMPGSRMNMSDILDRCRFQLELLKPMTPPHGGPEAFVEYTAQYAQLENDCMILSIKPDVHFNLVPASMLYQAILEGFEQSGMASGTELEALLDSLREIHDARVRNMYGKRRPTHIVYSLPAMEQFMRTGIQSDHFFIQRAYTPEERRELVRLLLRQTQEDPYFSIRFIRRDLPEIRSEMTFYEGKGVLLLDAYTSYDLHDDHSEALITLPEFMQSFQQFFMETLLSDLVMSRAESLAALEGLLEI